MLVLVLSDVHGNLPALEYVLKQQQNVDLVISLGDVVNYGPWSNECVDLLNSLKNKILIKGNHEDAFISGVYKGSNIIANTFFDFCFPSFERTVLIREYLEKYTLLNFQCVHTINDAYIFPDTEVQINENTFIGHSHKQFRKAVNQYTLVNVGSVGQNRSNLDILNYVIWDTENNKLDLKSKTFRADVLLNEMRCRNYPQLCIEYIQSKRTS